METKIPIYIELEKEVLDKVSNIVNYYNTYQKLHPHANSWEAGTIEQFIKGSVIREIERVETYNAVMVHGERHKRNSLVKNRIKEIAAQRNMRQLDLAEMTGIERANLSLIFNNRNQPSADYLLRIHAALGFIPLDQIFYREERK